MTRVVGSRQRGLVLLGGLARLHINTTLALPTKMGLVSFIVTVTFSMNQIVVKSGATFKIPKETQCQYTQVSRGWEQGGAGRGPLGSDHRLLACKCLTKELRLMKLYLSLLYSYFGTKWISQLFQRSHVTSL